MWKARIFTLYPDLFPGPLASGLYKKAIDKKLLRYLTIKVKEFDLNINYFGSKKEDNEKKDIKN